MDNKVDELGKPQTQLIHIAVDVEILRRVDEIADRMCVNRSEFVRRAITQLLRRHYADVKTFPPPEGVDVLMTDDELEELHMFFIREQQRRRYRKGEYLQRRRNLLN